MTDSTPSLENVIQIDESRIHDHFGQIVRSTVEETFNAMLEAAAEQLCQAARYERTEERKGYRAGHDERTLHTTAGEVRLKVPKLKQVTFETAISERYRRRESSVEEALIEMYLAGVSVRRVEDITEALWGTRVSAGTVSRRNQQVYERIEVWRQEPLVDEFPYVYLDGIVLKRTWAGEVRNVSVLVAIGVDRQGFRRVLGLIEGAKEDKAGSLQLSCPLTSARALWCAALYFRCLCRLVGKSRRVLPASAVEGAARSISIATCLASCRGRRCARWRRC